MDGARRPGVSSRWLVPAAAALAAVAIGLQGAVGDPIWGDEVASARIVSEPGIGNVLARVRRSESAPPAWYVLAWAASRVDSWTGGTLFIPIERLRFLSVAFAAGAALLTAIWALRLLGDPFPAALAGFLVALGSVPTAYAEQLRAYALATFLSVVFGLLLERVSSRPGPSSSIALASSVWVGTMTHYFFFFTVLAGGVWLWLSRARLPGAKVATFALALGLLGFLPWAPALLDQAQHGRYRWIGGFDPEKVATLPGSLFFGPEGFLYGLARSALTLALAAGVGILLRRPGGSVVVALALLPITGAAALWAAGQPIFDERNMLVVAPFIAILVASSLLALPKRLIAPLALAGIAATLLGAAYAQATLGRIAYDRVAGALVDLGWDVDSPVIFESARAETSLRISVGWYLPGRPIFARAGPEQCDRAPVFAVASKSILWPWLERHRRQVEAAREFASYDHPARGRRNGRIVVARLRAPVDAPGEVFCARRRARQSSGSVVKYVRGA
jgi:hypothetical protein